MKSDEIFKNFVKTVDINKGKILPLDLKNNTLRMRLDNKQLLLVSLDNSIDVYILNKNENTIQEKLGTITNNQSLSELFNYLKENTISKYYYSLDSLQKSIKI